MRRSTLYAPRVRGDLDLGLEPSRISGGDQRWADLITPGGRLPGQTPQGILEENATPKYRVGTRRVVDDRVYRYTHADPDRILRCGYGCYSFVDYAETGVPTAQADAGTFTITLTAVGAVAVNEYAEGTLVIAYAGGAGSTRHKIKSNTVAVGTFTVTVYDAFIANVTVGLNVTLYHSPWFRINCMRQEVLDGVMARWQYVSFTGVPNRQITADNYFWLQTWGPCPCMLSGGNEGAIINDRDMHFDTNGAVVHQSYLAADHYQRAGFMVPEGTGGNQPNGVGEIYLQLAF